MVWHRVCVRECVNRGQTRRDEGSRKTDAKELCVVSKAEVGLLDLGSDSKNVRHTVRGTAACDPLSMVTECEDGKKKERRKKRQTVSQSVNEVLGCLKGSLEEKTPKQQNEETHRKHLFFA